MKLLRKSVLDAQVAKERKAQIDEGVMIANKVDILRRDLANLQAQHQQFIGGMKFELKKETEELITKVAVLKSELKVLEDRRRTLLEPLDDAWSEVKSKGIELDQKIQEVDQEREKILRAKEKIEKKLLESKESLSKIKIRERELDRAYDRANALREEIEEIKNQTISENTAKNKDITQKLQEAERLRVKAENDSIANEHLNQLLKEKEQELLVREIRLNDRYATLERTINRQKNGSARN